MEKSACLQMEKCFYFPHSFKSIFGRRYRRACLKVLLVHFYSKQESKFYTLMIDGADKTCFQPGNEPNFAQILCEKENFLKRYQKDVLLLLCASYAVNFVSHYENLLRRAALCGMMTVVYLKNTPIIFSNPKK